MLQDMATARVQNAWRANPDRKGPTLPPADPLPPGAMRCRAVLSGLAVAPAAAAATAALAQQAAPDLSAAAPKRMPCRFFNTDERRAVTALVARVISADELGPGAVEADVPVFMDRQPAGAYGQGAHFFRAGPFQPGTPEQGYQLALRPADLMREGLARLDAAACRAHGSPFADLAAQQQDALMNAMQDGKLDMGPVPSNQFFNTAVALVMEGFFADPLYGGNKDCAGWKPVGFPGSYASYASEIERYNLAWTRPPVPIEADQDFALQPGLPGDICVTR